MTPVLRAPTVGVVLADRYEIIRSIARGGMGEVFEAEDRQLRRRVAIKVFRSGAATDRVRFDAEVTVLARLSHPGLVEVFDAGEHAGDAFVVLELIDGPTLQALLTADSALGSERVAEVGVEVADALAYVHDHGVVHRDVTPANILCDSSGRTHLADFGIARLVDTTRLTATATTVGTAAYMAPEQIEGHDVTAAADVYALGLVLLELLTGRPAFGGTAQEAAVARLLRSPDVSSSPAAWRPLLASMTDRAPANRPTAAGVRDAVRSLAAGSPQVTGATAVAPALTSSLPLAEQPTEPVQIHDGTTLMPVSLQPADQPVPAAAGLMRSRGRVAVAVVCGVLLAVVAAAGAIGRSDESPTAPATTAAPTDPSVVPVTTTTTAAPVVTAQPPPPGKSHGKGQGRDNEDDD